MLMLVKNQPHQTEKTFSQIYACYDCTFKTKKIIFEKYLVFGEKSIFLQNSHVFVLDYPRIQKQCLQYKTRLFCRNMDFSPNTKYFSKIIFLFEKYNHGKHKFVKKFFNLMWLIFYEHQHFEYFSHCYVPTK